MLGRSVAFNIVGQAGSLAVGFVASIVVARLLGPSDRGLLALAAYVAELVVAIGGIGLPYAVVYYASRKDARPGALLGNSLAWGLGLAAVVVPAAWLLAEPIADALSNGRGEGAWVAAGVLVPIQFLDWSIHNQLFGRLRFGYLNVLIVASRVAALAAVIALVGLLDLGVVGALGASMAASIVMIFGSLAVLRRVPGARPRLDGGLLRRMISYGSRVSVGSLFQLANYRADLLVLQLFVPLSVVGYYAVAQIVAELALTVAAAFQTSITTLAARLEGDERQAGTTVRSLRHHGILTAAAIAANAVVGSLVILYAYGPDFRPALVPMLILLPGMWFLATGVVVTGDLRGRGRPGLSSLLAGITVVVTIALDFALIPPFGANGAAIASLVAYTAFGLLSLAALSRVVGLPVRHLVVPTAADLAAYPAAARTVARRVRGRPV